MRARLRASKRLRKTEEWVLNFMHCDVGEGGRSAEDQPLGIEDDGAHCRVVGDFEDELARAICRLPPLDAISRLLGCIHRSGRSRGDQLHIGGEREAKRRTALGDFS